MSNINISDFKKIRQNELKTFADTIYANTFDKPMYLPFRQAVIDMNVSAIAYQIALVDADKGGKEKVWIKDAAKTELYNQLNRIAKLMDIEWTNNEQDYLKQAAGFTLNKSPQPRPPVTFVNPPSGLQAYNAIAKGLIIVKWEKAENAVTTAFEVAHEDGIWRNGLYNNGKSMELTFPFGTLVKIRSKTIGPDSITSVFSETVEVMVS